jgi:zinc transporter ZupT
MHNANSFATGIDGRLSARGDCEGKLQDYWTVAVNVALAFILAMLGAVISISTAVSHERLCRLISLAAGTLLGVTCFSIIPESYSAMSFWQLATALVSGYALFYLISKYVFHVCPACAASHFDEAATHRFSEIATAMIIALGLHSTMDGLALTLGKDSEVTGALNATLLLAICVHKAPEGLALCALLLAAGFRRTAALGVVAAVESTTLFGGALGLWVLPQVSDLWLHGILAHVGGGFVFLALHAVFGELVKHGRKPVLLSFASGILLIAALVLGVGLTPH